ncbi:hypothetical protein SK128_010025 [Halocaridina rubra]|uniref:Fanconi anemia group I protein n=1 Tax=Halocaridina rubra TaxID=373956 RepID=A0AAN8WGY1_HALRR
MESRQVAVLGIIKFLRHFQVKGTLPSSQASTSFSSSLSTVSIANVHSVFNSATNEALCLELLGVLRRCFSQQQEVKSVLYGGLYDVCKDNPKLTVSILELLHQQSKQFLDLRPTTLNPVILKKVVNLQGNSVSIVEPVGELLSSLGSCKLYFEKRHEVLNEAEEVDSEENTVSVLNDICSLFDIVVEKLSGCELFDLGIDPQGDYSLSSTAGEKNVASVKVMMNVYDSLIEYTFSQGANVLEAKMKVVLQLFKSQKKLIDLLKEKSAKSGKKEGAKGKNRSPSKSPVVVKSNLSLSVVAEMLKVSYSKDDADNPNCVDLLKENHELQLYLLSFVEVTLTTFKEMTVSEKEKLLLHMKVIASVLLHECVENIASHDSSDKRIVQRIRQSLIILSTLITLFCKYYTKKLESIFREVTHQNDNKDVNSLLHKVYKKCQKMLLKILQHEDMSPLQRDAITITNIMSTVCQAMDPACEEITEVQNWILQLCKDQEGDSSVAESLMRLLFFLSDQIKVKHTLTRAISRELHHKLGDLEEGVEVEEVGNYKLVTETTSCYILPVLLTHIEETLGWMELVLNKMKACVATEAEYDANKIEKYLSTKCIVLIHTAHEIIQSALPLGNCMDNTLRVITKFYNILGLYVRYYLDLFKMRSSSQISEKFEKLVHTAGEMLTAPIYGTITYIEGVQRKDGAHISRTMKESKLIPSLIFSIEQFEKHLINLSRKSKVNLMQGMQLSTSRDFRILTSAMVEALQNEDEDGDNNDVDKVSDGDTNSGDETENPVNLRNNRESLSPGDTVEIHLSKDKSLSYIKGKGLGKSFKRKNTSDENTANAQNRQSQPPAKKSKPVKSKLGIAKKSNK